ncbi:Calcium-transporting ATPase 3, endoplasmic reticulum-type -like protein [Gossypium arboreum]|uniref:Calcium-transporting ATPase 3, endoplasmic reticulum-type-like protein n=1 Tax=Gossypium arboreum TaxID=29729 RepID=A0A0B0PCD4_GOSAR|nr:Calcium-transporting ATPase 3, endoplasmic reticulum-type -like protein [Gossypium arboreum]
MLFGASRLVVILYVLWTHLSSYEHPNYRLFMSFPLNWLFVSFPIVLT